MDDQKIYLNKVCKISNAVFVFYVAVILIYLTWIAARLQINYFDGFNIILNAQSIAAGDGESYFWIRTPLLPLFYSSLYLLKIPPLSGEFIMMLSRVVNVLFLTGLLWFSYKIFALHLNKIFAVSGTCLLAMNQLLIHYAPFTKEDIPCAFFTAGAFYFYLKSGGNKSWKTYLLVSLFITATITTRYNLVPLIFGVVILYELMTGRVSLVFEEDQFDVHGELFLRKLVMFFVLPLSMLFIIPATMYHFMDIVPFTSAPFKMFDEVLVLMSEVGGKEPPIENFQFLLQSCSLPVIICAVLGFVMCIKKKSEGVLFHTLWLGVFLVFQTYVIGHKESRYLIPMFIPLYYFAANGVSTLVHYFSEPQKAGPLIVILVVFALPVKNAAYESFKFQDPVFKVNFQKEVSQYSKQLAGDNNIHWVGRMYPVHPENYIFHEEDEYTDIYHFYNQVVRFYTGKKIHVFEEAGYLLPDDNAEGIFVHGIGNYVESGDALIINIEGEHYNTKKLPEKLSSLIVTKTRTISFYPVSAEKNKVNFISDEMPNARVELFRQADGYDIIGKGMPTTNYFEVYIVEPDKDLPMVTQPLKTINGEIKVSVKGKFPSKIERIFILGYFDTKEFKFPGREEHFISLADRKLDMRKNFIIEPGREVKIDYVLKVNGQIKYNTMEKGPLVYTHGQGGILAALERGLEGLKIGDQKVITIDPKDGFGVEDPNFIEVVSIASLPQGISPQIGLTFDVEYKTGKTYSAAITEVRGDKVVLNFNPPLAGKTLEYSVKVLDIQ